MEYITIKEASEKWGISVSRIGILVNEGRIPGAKHFGRSWQIPADAVKPPERKGGRTGSAVKEKKTDSFYFPLFHFRPDWSEAQQATLTDQQRNLLLAETAVLECRFEDAYPILKTILVAPDDSYIEIGALWSAGMCCVALNKAEDFSRFYLRLKLLLAKDFPHRDDMMGTLISLSTYVKTITAMADSDPVSEELHPQALPIVCVLKGYTQMVKEATKPGSADPSLLEVILSFLNNTGSDIAVAMMHLYLLGIYSLRRNTEKAEKHAKAVVQIAYANKIYFPLVSYYHYTTAILSPILDSYPMEFQNLCREKSAQYENNYTAFIASINKSTVLANLTDGDYPYAFAVLMELTNTHIAEELGVSMPTVSRKLEKLCNKLGVKTKKELKKYLQSNI